MDGNNGAAAQTGSNDTSSAPAEGTSAAESGSLNDVLAAAYSEVNGAGQEQPAPAADENAEAAAAAAEQSEAAAADANGEPQAEQKAEEADTALKEWTTADDAALAALPAETQALVERRVASATAKSAEDVKLASDIRSIVDPSLKSRLEQSGMSLPQGVEYLAKLERFATEKPADYLAFVANTVAAKGVDVAKVLGFNADAQNAQPAQEQGAPDPFQDPRYADLEKRLGVLTDRMQNDARTQAMTAADREIAALRDAKGADGKPLRPYFAEVENDMARLLSADRSMTLEAAYDAAVWGNPAVRAKLQEADRAATVEKARNDAVAAQKAAKGNVRSGGRPTEPNPQIDNPGDAVRAALAEVTRG